jgi:hypothetical protein
MNGRIPGLVRRAGCRIADMTAHLDDLAPDGR